MSKDIILVSSHVLDCGQIMLPTEVVIRVNLAWVDCMATVFERLDGIEHDIFLDNPVGRTKPPNYRYSLEQLQELVGRFDNVRYIAVSNVEGGNDLAEYQNAFPANQIQIVPKIETIKGIGNIKSILRCLGEPSMIMLDHDDLCSDLIRYNIDPGLMYTDYINPLLNICAARGCCVLRTQGIVFSSIY